MTKVQSHEMAQICKDGVRKTKAQNELSVAVNNKKKKAYRIWICAEEGVKSTGWEIWQGVIAHREKVELFNFHLHLSFRKRKKWSSLSEDAP